MNNEFETVVHAKLEIRFNHCTEAEMETTLDSIDREITYALENALRLRTSKIEIDLGDYITEEVT